MPIRNSRRVYWEATKTPSIRLKRHIERIEDGRSGRCEQCGEQIPKVRLDAIPYAAECGYRLRKSKAAKASEVT